jgi:alkanesulfonate monooxygenase SsuD/methylene tetrahydromethanopterin reductase-like flavin-dependent oxidoreductase (luciferase family)
VTPPVSVTLPQFHPDGTPLVDAARRAEALGFTGVFLFDHLYPLDGPKRPVVELFAALGAVAAATSLIRVGSLVARATTRPPDATASGVAAVQAVSGGRMVAGLGAGDTASKGEMDAYGLAFPPFEERLETLRRTIVAIRQLEDDGLTTPPVWVGGRHRRVREVAAEQGDGWNAWGADPGALAAEASEVWRAASRHVTISWGGAVFVATDPAHLTAFIEKRGGSQGIIAGVPEEVASRLGALLEAGADELVLSLLPSSEPFPTWELFVERVWPLL